MKRRTLKKNIIGALQKMVTVVSVVMSFESASIGQTTENSGIYTHYISRLTGIDDLANGKSISLTYATDNIEKSYPIQNVVGLKILEEAQNFITDSFNATIQLNVSYGSSASTTTTVPVTLAVSYKPGTGIKYNALQFFSYKNASYLSVAITDASGLPVVNGFDTRQVLELSNEMSITHFYDLASGKIPTFYPSVFTGDALNVQWNWPVNTGNNNTQLEWTWLEDELAGNYNGTNNQIDTALLFANNATRVDLSITDSGYAIPMFYDGQGKLYYRIRAINNSSSNGTNTYGPWFNGTPYSYSGHNDSLNWQVTTSYAEEGKRKTVIQYFDGSLKNRQTVTKDNTTNTTIVAETFYDGEGRPAVQVLPAPTMNNVVQYVHNLNFFNNTTATSNPALAFDLEPVNRPLNVAFGQTPVLDSSSGTSKYYSSNNELLSSGDSLARYIPDASGYPYTVTRYTPDATGRIMAQSGVGPAHQIGSGHETLYYYGTAPQEELDGLFGTEVGDAAHYFKNMVSDANGQMSVSYVDMHGRTVATALAGDAPVNTQALDIQNSSDYPNQSGSPLTVNLLNKNINEVRGTGIEAINSILVPYNTTYNFSYNLNPQSLQLPNCTPDQPLCYDCLYDLTISITDESGNYPPIVRNFSNITLDTGSTCIQPPFISTSYTGEHTSNISSGNTISFSETLKPGSYSIRKTLTMSEASLQKMDSVYQTKINCISYQHILDSVTQSLQSQSNCGASSAAGNACKSCMDSLGSFNDYVAKYEANLTSGQYPTLQQMQAMYSNDSAHCALLCGSNGSATLQAIQQQMLSDMMPYTGQYAQDPSDHSIIQGTMFNKYNIFSTNNNSRQPFYQNPYNPDTNNPGVVYFDALGDTVTAVMPLASLSPDVYVQNYDANWANQLLPYHPEYAKLQYAIKNLTPSYAWIDNFMANDITWAQGSTLINSQGDIANDPIRSFGNIGTSLDNAVSGTQYHGGMSMWQIAYGNVFCKTITDPAQQSNCYSSAPFQPFQGAGYGNATPDEKNLIWQYFSTEYAGYRDSLLSRYLDQQVPLTDADNLVSQGYKLYFPVNDIQTAQQYGWTWYPGTSTNPSAVPDTAALTNSYKAYNLNSANVCLNYPPLWKAQLLQCPQLSSKDSATQAAILKEITDRMTAVCMKSWNAAVNPNGASTLPPGTSPTSYGDTSFEQIINSVYTNHGISANASCNPYVINFPKAYGQNQPLTPSYISMLDTCTCSRFNALITEANNAGYAGNTQSGLNNYLRTVYNDTITASLYNSLITGCPQLGNVNCFDPVTLQPVSDQNSNGDGTCTYYVPPVTLPGSDPNNYSTWDAMYFSEVVGGWSKENGNNTYSTLNAGTLSGSVVNLIPGQTYYLQLYLEEYWYGIPNDPGTNVTFTFPFGTYHLNTYTNDYVVVKYVPTKSLYSNYSDPIPYTIQMENPSAVRDGFYASFDFPGVTCPNTTTDTLTAFDGTYTCKEIAPCAQTCDTVTYYPLVTPQPLPQFLQCGYVKTNSCYTCNQFNQWAAEFKASYPAYSSAPDYNNLDNIDSITATGNALFADFVNAKTGLQYNWRQYAQLVNNVQCTLNGTGGGDAPVVCPTGYAVDNLDVQVRGNNAPGSYVARVGITFEPGFTSGVNDTLTAYIDPAQNLCTVPGADTVGFASLGGSPTVICRSTTTYLTDTAGLNLPALTDPCNINAQAVNIAQNLYFLQQQQLLNNFDSAYKAKCLAVQNIENFTVTDTVKLYHFTLYYYDQAGNLVKTIPPKGVHPNWDSTYIANVEAAKAAGTQLTPAHTFATNYRYNSLNQVTAQNTPDAATAYSWYDRLGRLVVSQNAKQASNNQYSYTLYDDIGRITEVGQTTNTTAISQLVTQDDAQLSAWISNGNREQITQTVYDTAYAPVYGLRMSQKNLRNRVSYTSYYNTYADIAGINQQSATYYDYDVHGNIDTLLQDYKGIAAMNNSNGNQNRFKLITYNYDLISGKVNRVNYQPDSTDAFYHRYEYDAENRLTEVYTSRDKIYWERDAAYQYYKHGPLARTVLGQQQVQGLTYAYTLQGWLKAVNPDSTVSGVIAKNAYGYQLNYFGGDYLGIGANNKVANLAPITPLYNGNIGSMAVRFFLSSSGGAGGGFSNGLQYQYNYDQLNRLVAMDAYKATDNAWNGLQAIDDYKERISYDPNGNIITYLRNGTTANDNQQAMDNLTYNYNANTNQLNHINDAVNSSNYTEDIDDQNTNNYIYDAIGNLQSDAQAGINNINWTVYGKIASITKTDGTTINYQYDAAGNRISKVVTKAGVTNGTYYVRDAQGNVLSVYQSGSSTAFTQTEKHLYGSNRLGLTNTLTVPDQSVNLPDGTKAIITTFTRGEKLFELSNHLGNVLVTVTDKKLQHASDNQTVDYYNADVASANDYYPFGMQMPNRIYNAGNYRYGFNGKELDKDIDGNNYDYGARIYNPQIGKFLSTDPLQKQYPYYTPYQFAGNTPIMAKDLDGKEIDFGAQLYLWYTSVKLSLSNAGNSVTQHMNNYVSASTNNYSHFDNKKDIGAQIQENQQNAMIAKTQVYADFAEGTEKALNFAMAPYLVAAPEFNLISSPFKYAQGDWVGGTFDLAGGALGAYAKTFSVASEFSLSNVSNAYHASRSENLSWINGKIDISNTGKWIEGNRSGRAFYTALDETTPFLESPTAKALARFDVNLSNSKILNATSELGTAINKFQIGGYKIGGGLLRSFSDALGYDGILVKSVKPVGGVNLNYFNQSKVNSVFTNGQKMDFSLNSLSKYNPQKSSFSLTGN